MSRLRPPVTLAFRPQVGVHARACQRVPRGWDDCGFTKPRRVGVMVVRALHIRVGTSDLTMEWNIYYQLLYLFNVIFLHSDFPKNDVGTWNHSLPDLIVDDHLSSIAVFWRDNVILFLYKVLIVSVLLKKILGYCGVLCLNPFVFCLKWIKCEFLLPPEAFLLLGIVLL